MLLDGSESRDLAGASCCVRSGVLVVIGGDWLGIELLRPLSNGSPLLVLSR